MSYGGDTLLALVEGYNYTEPTTVPFEIINDLDSVITRDTLRFTGTRAVEPQVVRIVPDSQPLGELRLRVGSGTEATQSREVVEFSQISVSSGLEIEVKVGQAPSVVVRSGGISSGGKVRVAL